MSDHLAEIRRKRGLVYGDPLENHAGIGAAWTPLLQPIVNDIRDGHPVPPHVVALLLAAMKLNRMRRVYHDDNYDDIANYLGFAQEWQKTHTRPPVVRHRVYVSGPYTAPTRDGIVENVQSAAMAAAAVMDRGHLAHCPHAATDPVSHFIELSHGQWLDLDFTFIRYWATGVLYLAPSPGADAEVAYAEKIGLPVWASVDEIPFVEGGEA